jgi:prepilin-type N-terminal cleavage/methylation domain-containing protein/prepilin-type processing-associated H-X9-DG protein
MKKAFTLIELLVVIAIIAILAAILFPVFAQAKLAAKKSVDLSNMKQMATASFMYYNDYDDTLFLYRTSTSDPTYNPFHTDPNVGANSCAGSSSSKKQFWNVLLYPYIKSYDLFKGPGVTNAWVNIEPNGGSVSGPGGNPDCSYGGQNSYGVNRIAFNANQPALNASSIVDSSGTLIITDGTYYDLMPKMTDHNASGAWAPLGQFIGDPGQTKYAVDELGDCGYYNYWVQLGGGACDGTLNTITVDAETKLLAKVLTRNAGRLNGAFADGHAKSYDTTQLVYDLVDNGNKLKSVWDPWKQGVR